MKHNSIFFKLFFVCVITFILSRCTTQEKQKVDPVEANIKMYAHMG